MFQNILLKIVSVATEAVETKPSNKIGIPLTLAAITEPTIAAISLPPKHDKISITLLNFFPCNFKPFFNYRNFVFKISF